MCWTTVRPLPPSRCRYAGQYDIGYFTATGTTETFYVTGIGTGTSGTTEPVGQMNALMVRDETGVNLAFTLTSYTAAQNVYAGKPAMFSVTMLYSNAPNYQWQSVKSGVTNNLTNGATGTGSTFSGRRPPP